jgi:hypothetical protein
VETFNKNTGVIMKKTNKSTVISSATQRQIDKNQQLGNTLSGGKKEKPIIVTDAKKAQRLLSRLITKIQTGEINSSLAKDTCYLLSVFIQIRTAVNFEERLDK